MKSLRSRRGARELGEYYSTAILGQPGSKVRRIVLEGEISR